MSHQAEFSFLAQTETGQLLSEGIFESEHGACLVDDEINLASLVSGCMLSSGSPRNSIEILRDDMRTNIAASPAADCLNESLTNIHEYLVDTNGLNEQGGLDMIAWQHSESSCHIISSGDYQCLFSRQQVVSTLLQAIPQPPRIGSHQNPTLQTVAQPLQAGDLMVLIGLSDIELIGEEFLKLSLARFGDNPSTALRQINTRVAHTGKQTKPTLIFVQCISPGDQPGGWFHNLLST